MAISYQRLFSILICSLTSQWYVKFGNYSSFNKPDAVSHITLVVRELTDETINTDLGTHIYIYASANVVSIGSGIDLLPFQYQGIT